MAFKVRAPKELMNPYEWMPGFGEHSVRLFSDGRQLNVEIAYQADEDEPDLRKRELQFSGVCAYYHCLFPGATGPSDMSFEGKWPMGSLVEFQHSELADSWRHYLSRNVRHFLIQFTDQNVQVHVLADTYSLTEPVAI